MKAAPAQIMTIPELRKFIKEADVVLGVLRFGASESWIKISKKEALFLVRDYADTDTPEELEMFGGSFGSLEIETDGTMTLHLG